MKKTIWIPGLAMASVFAGMVSWLLRWRLLTTCVDEKGLLIPGAPLKTLSWVLTAGVILLVVVSVWKHRDRKIVIRSSPASQVARILAMALGVLMFWNAAFPGRAAAIAAAVTAAIAAWELLGGRNKVHPAVADIPGVLFFLLALLSCYRVWSAEPETQRYVYCLLAMVCLMMATYQRSAVLLGLGKGMFFLASGFLGVYFAFAAGADPGFALLFPVLGLWMFAQLGTVTEDRVTMFLPEHIHTCVRMLEKAGFAAYAVGGCVRDALLGLEPQDYDLCTNAKPEEVEKVFADFRQILAGEKHGTVTVMMDGMPVEITTFRTEGDYTDSRHPQWVAFVPDVKEDLARRDFTVNAMAYSPTRGFADPFGGREDLQNRVLRAVGDPAQRFTEDALRILRGVRFAVRYRLQVEPDTRKAMEDLAFRMEALSRERVFSELCKLLPLVTAEDLLQYEPVITQVIPELQPLWGFDQKNRHHIYDAYTHTAQVVAAVPADLTLRWAALLHDIGKPASFSMGSDGQGHFYGHAAVSAEMADGVLHRLKAPTALRERVVLLIEKHMVWLEATKPTVRRWISRLGMETMVQLMTLQEADTGGKGTEDPAENPYFSGINGLIREIAQENACLGLKDLTVNGHDLMGLGLSGKAVGQALNRLLELVIDEEIPNEKQALLARIQEEML